MKKSVRKLSGRLLVGLASAAILPVAAWPDEPVRLKAAYGQVYAVSGMTFDWTTIDVNVKNIAFQKSVVMHYKDPAVGTWKDFPLIFSGHYGNYDVFTGANAPTTQEFVIKYAVPGEEHWDNNGGSNYRIATFVGIVGGNVMLKKATSHIGYEAGGGFTFTTSWFDGEIYVQNLSFNKRVGVHYTADGGTTWNDVDGSYAGKVQAVANVVDSVEIWKFKTPTLNLVNPDTFRFAVYYELKDPGPSFGRQYWDNNFSQDYFVGKSDGTTIQ
jgi:Carbohydrate/starch-binding module (family 21)